MTTQSQEIGKLAEALAKAQAMIEGAVKDCSNPFFKSKYADLNSIWEACKGPLTENGLAIVQTFDLKDSVTFLVTTLIHASGQWMKSFLPLVVTKQDPQTQGSAITYARRYALAAITGVTVADEDDDAEGAMGRTYVAPPKPKEEPKLTKEQMTTLTGYFKDDPEILPRILTHYKVKSVGELLGKDFDSIVKTLQLRKERGKNEQTRVA